MQTVPLTQVKTHLSAYIRAAQKSPVVITKRGKPVAMLVSARDQDDMEMLVLAHDPRFIAILERGREQVRRTGGIPHKEFWARVKKRHAQKKSA